MQLIVNNNIYYGVVRRKLDSLTAYYVNIIDHPTSLSMKLLKH